VNDPIAARISAKLTAALSPSVLEVIDDSARHAGHAGARAWSEGRGGESHFRVRIVSGAFRGQNRLDRQRLVYRLLAEEMVELHALSLRAETPEEAMAEEGG
jgi:BolA protein